MLISLPDQKVFKVTLRVICSIRNNVLNLENKFIVRNCLVCISTYVASYSLSRLSPIVYLWKIINYKCPTVCFIKSLKRLVI
jgi:hypothetical protein